MEEIRNEMNEVTYDLEPEDYTIEDSNDSGKSIGLTVGLIATTVAVGAALWKRHKAKKKDENGEPKKKTKKKLMWVDVPVEDKEAEVVETETEPSKDEE